MDLLKYPAIISDLRRAWQESQADDPDERHEEGGYILLNPDLSYSLERWPRGEQSRIEPPTLDADNCYNGRAVVAAFHTHPNPPVDEVGRAWEQGPSRSDRRWHERRRLRGLVLGHEFVYEIDASGSVTVVGTRDEVLS